MGGGMLGNFTFSAWSVNNSKDDRKAQGREGEAHNAQVSKMVSFHIHFMQISTHKNNV